MSTKSVYVYIDGGVIVYPEFLNEYAVKVKVQSVDVLNQIEKEDSKKYNDLIAMVDSGTAVVTSENNIAVYDYQEPWSPGDSIYTMARASFEKLFKNNNAKLTDSEIPYFKKLTYEINDGKGNGEQSPEQAPTANTAETLGAAFGAMSGNSDMAAGAALNAMATGSAGGSATPENFMNRPREDQSANERQLISGGDSKALFCSMPGSNSLITAAILRQECKAAPDIMMGDITLDGDKRYPTKYLPTIYQKEAGFVTLHRGNADRAGSITIPTRDENYSYHFYKMVTNGLEMFPDVLADVITADSGLQEYVDMTGRVKIVVNGIKGMFSDEDEEEKKDAIKKIYIEFFRKHHYFKIIHISWKTGWVSALTPDYKPVLLCAAMRTGNINVYELKSFIPISRSIGLAVVGFDNIDMEKMNTFAGEE
jgi:hypothetical protein